MTEDGNNEPGGGDENTVELDPNPRSAATVGAYASENEERGRGILSPADREFLLTNGENLKTSGARSKARLRIRQRIRDAFMDFELIQDHLDDDEARMTVEGGKQEFDADHLFHGMSAAIDFMYRGINRSEPDFGFRDVLEVGIYESIVRQRGGFPAVDVTFTVDVEEATRVDQARRKYERGQKLSAAEIGALLASGAVEPDEAPALAEHAQENAYLSTMIGERYSPDDEGDGGDGPRLSSGRLTFDEELGERPIGDADLENAPQWLQEDLADRDSDTDEGGQ